MPDRRPFDPKRVRQPARKPPADRQMITPSRLNELIQTALRMQLPSTLTVLGEVGDLSRAQSGHLYFSLKDANGEIRCVMWRSNAVRVQFDIEPGMELVATGAIDVYPPRGTYQLLVRALEPRGVGALEVAFRQLREKLAAEGLFDPDRKRKLPFLPDRIGVVTSPSGAAVRDITQTLRRRCPTSEVLLFPARVQGDGAANEVAGAIHAANRLSEQFGGIDVLIVGRGGGSLEDLWAFNEEIVARAIHASEIPVVSAVGHEVDLSIADLVADVRAATPTAAAELVVPVRTEIISRLETATTRALRAAAQRTKIAQHELFARLRSDGLAQPLQRVQRHGQQVDELLARLEISSMRTLREVSARLGQLERRLAQSTDATAMQRLREQLQHLMQRARDALRERVIKAEQEVEALQRRAQQAPVLARRDLLPGHIEERLHRLDRALQLRHQSAKQRLETALQLVAAFDPKKILQRGYSITRDAKTGRVLRDAETIHPGQRLRTELAEGQVESTADDPRQGRLFE